MCGKPENSKASERTKDRHKYAPKQTSLETNAYIFATRWLAADLILRSVPALSQAVFTENQFPAAWESPLVCARTPAVWIFAKGSAPKP